MNTNKALFIMNSKTTMRAWLATLFYLLLNMAPAMAQDFHDHKDIMQTATRFMNTHAQQSHSDKATVVAGKLDSRLHLKKCDSPLKAYLPRGSRDLGKTTVGIKCHGTKPWSLHVPVSVGVIKNIAVASRLLHRGHVITKADIKYKNIDLATLPQGYIELSSELIHQKLKRRLAPGSAFTPASVEKPKKVKRGQRVTILARSGAMEVRMTGKALSSGAVGERIKVINLKSKQKREGTINNKGDIIIDL